VPHEMLQMAMFKSTSTSTLNLQPRIAGDMALMRGLAKYVLETAHTDPTAIDRRFIERYTSGFKEYEAVVNATPWEELERQSGISRQTIEEFGSIYDQIALGDLQLVPGSNPARARS
jgi:anaerobic selenocysteine-containing dehydrogenase